VVYLTGEGIPRPEAEQNLALMLNILSQAYAERAEKAEKP
jgi:hypothetical protein